MFSQDLVLADAAAANKTFKLVFQDGAETRRIDSATDLTNARMMIIRHQTSGRNGITINRHNVLLSKKLESAEGDPLLPSVSVAISVPEDVLVTQGVIDDLIAFAKNFLTVANTTSLLRGES